MLIRPFRIGVTKKLYDSQVISESEAAYLNEGWTTDTGRMPVLCKEDSFALDLRISLDFFFFFRCLV